MPAKHDDIEIEQRLQKILQGAFAGPPTPLKDIPTVKGKVRRIGKKRITRRRKPKSAAA